MSASLPFNTNDFFPLIMTLSPLSFATVATSFKLNRDWGSVNARVDCNSPFMILESHFDFCSSVASLFKTPPARITFSRYGSSTSPRPISFIISIVSTGPPFNPPSSSEKGIAVKPCSTKKLYTSESKAESPSAMLILFSKSYSFSMNRDITSLIADCSSDIDKSISYSSFELIKVLIRVWQ